MGSTRKGSYVFLHPWDYNDITCVGVHSFDSTRIGLQLFSLLKTIKWKLRHLALLLLVVELLQDIVAIKLKQLKKVVFTK